MRTSLNKMQKNSQETAPLAQIAQIQMLAVSQEREPQSSSLDNFNNFENLQENLTISNKPRFLNENSQRNSLFPYNKASFSSHPPYKKQHFDYFREDSEPGSKKPAHFPQNSAGFAQTATNFASFAGNPPILSANPPIIATNPQILAANASKALNIYRPHNYKTVPCRFFHSNIGCPRGDECHFIHDYNYMGTETPNMHKYVRPLNQLSHSQERNQRNMMLYGYMSREGENEPQEINKY